MNFLNPAFLIGLPLIGVPLIIHLLSRRQQKRISWGAMRFLQEAATRKRRLWKITDILLLLLRTLAFVFFICALARPLLPANWLGDSVPREVVLVLDQSLSMSRKAGGTSLFDLQRERATALLDRLSRRDSVRVLLAGDAPEWLTPEAVEVSPPAMRSLRRQIDQRKPTLGAAALLGAVREAVELEPPKGKSARMIVVFSDQQRFGWHLDDRVAWSTLQANVEQAAVPTHISLQFLTETELETNNLAVNGIEAPRAFAARNQSLNVTAQLRNHGSAASRPTLLTWLANDQPLGVATIPELAAGASTSVSIAHQFTIAGQVDLNCRLETKDALDGDNSAHFLVDVLERIPVLIIEAPGELAPGARDSDFLLASLGARPARPTDPSWRSVFDPTLLLPEALPATDLSRFRCLILTNVARVGPEVVEKLETYVRGGGGLWLALGPETDVTFFNTHLHRNGRGLAPLTLSAPIGEPNDRETFFTVRPTATPHPATALLSDFQRLDLDRARIYRRHQFVPFSGKDVSVLLQVQQGDSLVVERKFERGRVLVQSVPLGVSWSSLPLCQAYVAMVHEWLWYLVQPGLPQRNLSVGEMILESTDRGENRTAQLTSPDDRKIPLEPTLSTNSAQFRHIATHPGEYVLRVEGPAGSSSSARFLVHRNPAESDLKKFSDEELRQLRSLPGFQIGGDMDSAVATKGGAVAKHPLEGWLLAALPIVLLGEILLAGWTTQRRNAPTKPVTMGA